MKIEKVHAIPHFHSDLEWWKVEADYGKDCLAICRRAVELLESHPSFTYVLDQAYSVIPLLREDPVAAEKLKRYVRERRVEAVGGTMAAPDHNLPTAEALVRNLLLGKQWWTRRFGVVPRVGCGLDTFGHPVQLPQILAKSGLDAYYFSRGPNPFSGDDPSAFHWEAPDGSRVTAFWLVATYAGMVPVFPRLEWNVRYHLREMKARLAFERPRNPTPIHMVPMGFDFQKPSVSWVEFLTRWNGAAMDPPVEMSTPTRFFADLGRHARELPVRRTEMNPVYSGGYESRHEIKHEARRLERMALDWERLSTAAWLLGRAYPSEAIDEVWHALVKNDFHDTINGTPIDPVMREAFARAERAEAVIREGIESAVSDVAAKVDTSGRARTAVVVNPLPWPRTELVTLGPELARGKRAVDAGGRPLKRQPVPEGLLLEVKVPGLGVQRVDLRAGTNAGRSAGPRTARTTVLEDGHLTVHLDSRGLVGLAAGRERRETLRPSDARPAGLRVLEDFGNLWTVAPTGVEEEGSSLGGVRVLETGPLRSTAEVRARFPSCDVVTRYALLHGRGFLDVHTWVRLRERDRRILAWLPLAFRGDFVCETPYHATRRGTGHWACQGWAGVFGERVGLAAINLGIPSVVYEPKGLGLGLMRSVSIRPKGFRRFLARNLGDLVRTFGKAAHLTYRGVNLFEIAIGPCHWAVLREYAGPGVPYRPGLPGPLELVRALARYREPSDAWALGEHEFRYRLAPVVGPPRAEHLTRLARELASPVIVRTEPSHEGPIAAPASLLSIEGDAVCEVIKKAQGSADLVIRAYDASGEGAKLIVRAGRTISEASRISLTEDAVFARERPRGDCLEASLGPWEVATFLLSTRRSAGDGSRVTQSAGCSMRPLSTATSLSRPLSTVTGPSSTVSAPCSSSRQINSKLPAGATCGSRVRSKRM